MRKEKQRVGNRDWMEEKRFNWKYKYATDKCVKRIRASGRYRKKGQWNVKKCPGLKERKKKLIDNIKSMKNNIMKKKIREKISE